MRKSIYLLTTTPSSHTHRFHPLPLATPTSCSPHLLATPIHSTHSPQLSSILLTCAKFKVWMTIVESGWNVWVWLVGVVSRRWVWLAGVGGIYGCGCKEVYRFPHTTYPYSSCTCCICSFLQQHPYSLFIFFVLAYLLTHNPTKNIHGLKLALIHVCSDNLFNASIVSISGM